MAGLRERPRRLEVWRLKDGKRLVLNVQSDLLESLDTFVVVPLLRPGGFTAIEGINPIVQVAGQPFVLAVQGMTAIAGSQMRDRVADLGQDGEAVLRALDHLLTPP
jgi:toxin CcdB